MMNQYFGSWAGPAEGLAPALERVGKMFPDKMVVISEFGLAGLFAPDTAQADVKRIRIMKDQLAEFARHDFVAGAVFWCYQDYKSHRNLWPGETSGFVEMGLVDENRQRLPSYYAWKDETSPARLSVAWRQASAYVTPTGFKATVARRPPAEMPSYDLRGYSLVWEARDHVGTLLASGTRRSRWSVSRSWWRAIGPPPPRARCASACACCGRPASRQPSEPSAGGSRARAASARSKPRNRASRHRSRACRPGDYRFGNSGIRTPRSRATSMARS